MHTISHKKLLMLKPNELRVLENQPRKKFDEYELRGFINIKKKGMIQFSRFGENTKSYPWYVLLIR